MMIDKEMADMLVGWIPCVEREDNEDIRDWLKRALDMRTDPDIVLIAIDRKEHDEHIAESMAKFLAMLKPKKLVGSDGLSMESVAHPEPLLADLKLELDADINPESLETIEINVTKPKIYVWINERSGREMLIAYAISQDGHLLSSHVCSNEEWVKRDMGIIGNHKHDIYAKHYPDGFDLEYVPEHYCQTHAGLLAANALADTIKQSDENMAKVVLEMDNDSVIKQVF